MSVAGKPLVQKRPRHRGCSGAIVRFKRTFGLDPRPKIIGYGSLQRCEVFFIELLLVLFVCVVSGIYLWLRASLPQGSGPFMSLFNEDANVIQTFS
jgi:hypothetical protein